jgi:hypothetical protein
LAPLLKNPVVPIAIWLIGIGVGIGIERFRSRLRREAWRKRNAWRLVERNGMRGSNKFALTASGSPPAPRLPDAADQLRIVMGAAFTLQPLLNKSEARVLRELERCVDSCNPTWQVMAQVSLGEVLRSNDTAAFASINSKRVDLLLIDEECLPRHAIEYQGSGHHQGTAAARDAVKKEALRRAGIGYHEVVAGHTTPADLRRLVEKLVPRPAAAEQPQRQSLPRPEDTWRPATPPPHSFPTPPHP